MGSMSRWLDVEVGTDEIDLNTLPGGLALVDLDNNNDFKLLIGDLGRGGESPKLKVFKGAMQTSDMVLPDFPLGVVGFHSNETVPRSIPFIAIGFSSCLYIYKSMKLFYKYYLPSVELSVCETDIWKQLINPENHKADNIVTLTESLKSLPRDMITVQSRNFITMNTDQQLEYLEQIPEVPTKKAAEITCMTTLKMHSVDKYSMSCLVIGTEDGEVIVLDPQNFSQLLKVKICEVKRTPHQLVTTGLYTVDYSIAVATREKAVCLIKRDSSNEGRMLFSTDDHIISMEVMTTDQSIIVICIDNTLTCYSKKGKKQWSLCLEHRPVALALVPVLHLGLTLTAVALATGHVHFYDGKARRDTLFVRDVVSVMRFGQLGQEEHVLVIVSSGGNLILKILKRTADFNAHAAGIESPADAAPGQRPWLIPKKSKLFLEQSVRERDNAAAMHATFQRELNRTRVLAARTLLEAHTRCDNALAAGALEPVRLSAEVEGMGPVFRVTLALENTSSEKAVVGLSILFHVPPTNYKVANPYIKVPLVAPSSRLRFPARVEEMFGDELHPDVLFRAVTGESGERSLLKVLLLKEGRATPVLAATVRMPPTDPAALPHHVLQPTAAATTATTATATTRCTPLPPPPPPPSPPPPPTRCSRHELTAL